MGKDSGEGPSALALFVKNALAAGCSASFAELCTISLDTAKVRLQIQNQMPEPPPRPYKNMADCLKRIASEEGVAALFKGIGPGVMRQLIFASLRLGMYEPVRDNYVRILEGPDADLNSSNFSTKVLTGLTTGSIAMCVAQPTDLVKIRLQAQSIDNVRYKGIIDAFTKIPREGGGIKALWRGLGPNVIRNSVINAAELSVYDQIKQLFLGLGFSDTPSTHCMSAFSAGFAATCVGSPFDVVKTRIMQGSVDAAGKPIYRGFVHCFGQMLTREGPMAFYGGFVPNYLRIGCWNVVMFLTYEQVKKKFGDSL